MTDKEEQLIFALSCANDNTHFAVLLQNYIQEHGPLGDDAASKVKELINERRLKGWV